MKKYRKLSKKLKITSWIMALLLTNSTLGYGIDITTDLNNKGLISEINKNGVKVTKTGLNIENSGSIVGSSSNSFITIGNGIFSQDDIGNITNSGSIAGISSSSSSSSSSTGNGIFSQGNIGNITNSGSIAGASSSSSSSGNGIFSNTGIGRITNSGSIVGASTSTSTSTGNGIYNNSSTGNITNSGSIVGFSSSFIAPLSIGNGIYSLGKIGNIINSGSIVGSSVTSAFTPYTGNGIYSNAGIGNITNSGSIVGSSISSSYSGNGIYSGGNIGEITNNGIIKGSRSAIEGPYTSLTNNGILAGEHIVTASPALTRNGIEVTLNSSGAVGSYVLATGGLQSDGVTIFNGSGSVNDSSLTTSGLTKSDKIIVNGIGESKGALVIDKSISLNDSIVNGLYNAIYLENESKLTATNTTLNGGAISILNGNTFDDKGLAIKGSNRDNEVSLLGDSFINGDVDLGDGNDALTLDNTTQINGYLNGGKGTDTFNLGKAGTTGNLNILHNISGFETLNTNGDITLFETTEVTGADNINLESGNLTLRVDPTKVVGNKVIGHALYGNTGTLKSTGGNLVLGLNGLGENKVISMGGTSVDQTINDSWWKNSDHLKTNSLVLDAKLSADGKDIYITTKASLPLTPSTPITPPTITPPTITPPTITPPTITPPTKVLQVTEAGLYDEYNKAYQSINSAHQLGALLNTTLLDNKSSNESLNELYVVLDQLYRKNPYAYTLKSSRDSLKLFEDNMSYLTIKPEADQWIVQGKGIHSGVRNDNTSDHGFETSKTTTNTIGGMATGEYGYNDNISLGLVVGGNNQDVNFKGNSKIDGTSLYLGTFARAKVNNFEFKTGIGYQYTSSDVDRVVSNKYDRFKSTGSYGINSLNTFAEAKYIKKLGNDWALEPKTGLSIYYVNQDGVNEGYDPNELNLSTNKVTNTTMDLNIGLDVTKTVYIPEIKINHILSIGVTHTLGDTNKSLSGNVLGKDKKGSEFKIKGTEIPEITGELGYDVEIEHVKGMIYSAGVNYEFAKDKNQNINVKIGVGYRF